MDLIRINDNKVKIMLTPSDMQCYDLNTDTLDYTDEGTRRALRTIFHEVRDRMGFDTEGTQIYVQLYPSREGGCEMFVTKTGPSGALGDKKESSSPTVRGNSSFTRTQTDPASESKRERAFAFAFENIEHLLTICHRLNQSGYGGDSAAFRSEDGRYYLLLSDRGCRSSSPWISHATLAFIHEYGRQESVDAVRLYIHEHGRIICEKNAVPQLAKLA